MFIRHDCILKLNGSETSKFRTMSQGHTASKGVLEVLTLKLPDKLQPYGLYTYYVVHICDFGIFRVKQRVMLL